MRTNLIPIAGSGSRFAGYPDPKPFLPVAGVPMIRRVVDNLPPADRWVIVAQAEHADRYDLAALVPEAVIVTLDAPTSGAAESCLAAADLLEGELVVANGDQLIRWDGWDFASAGTDGVIPTFRAAGAKWLYCHPDGRPTQTDTHLAQCGVYWYRDASEFAAAAELLAGTDRRIGWTMAELATVSIWPVKGMYGLGTPSDYEAFQAHPTVFCRNLTATGAT